MRRFRSQSLPLLLTAGVFVLAGVELWSRPQPAVAEPFHQAVLKASEQAPMTVGNWVGASMEVPPAAVALLKPNVIMHRRYQHRITGRVVDVLVVQCRDARDMAGHYPPICYPSNGWTDIGTSPAEWDLGTMKVTGMEYRYKRLALGRWTACVVSNVIAMPDGRYVRDMDEIRAAAGDYLRHFYGAAQVQVVVDEVVPDAERHAIVRELLSAYGPLLEQLRGGASE